MALSAPELAVLIKAKDEASGVLKRAGASVRGFGGAMDALKPVLLASTAAAAAMGAGLFKLGKDFDEAFDTIRVGTGATGMNLAQLQDDFKFVVKEIPTDFSKASAAIADLNTLTGLTGPVLQDAAKRGLEAARLLGEDSAALFGATARALNSFEVSGQDAGAVMDQLFVASQATGVPMGALAGQLQTYGPVLKNLGLGITESTALFGSLSKAGIDASRVLPGLNAFMRKLAKEGVTDMQAALSVAIADIKGAESASEALNIATASFGAEGAQRMSVAVRTGALDLDRLINMLNTSGGAIMKTSRDTQSFGEHWQVALNNISVAVEPASTRIFDLASTLLGNLSPALETGLGGLVDFAEKGINFIMVAWDNSAGFRDGLRQLAAAILPSVGTAIASLQQGWEQLAAAVLPRVSAAIASLQQGWEQLAAAVLPRVSAAIASLQQGWEQLAAAVLPRVSAAIASLQQGWEQLAAAVLPRVSAAIASLQQGWEQLAAAILPSVGTAIASLQQGWEQLAAAVLPRVSAAIASLQQGWEQLAAAILPSVGTAIASLQQGWEQLIPKLQEAWDNLEPLRDMLKQLAAEVLPTALPLVQLLATVMETLAGHIKEVASQAIPALFAAVGAVLDGFNNLVAFGKAVKQFFTDNQWAVDAVASALIALAVMGIGKLLLALPGLIASVAAATVAFLAQAAAAAAAAVATLAAAAPFLALGLAIAGVIFIAIQIIRNWDTIIEKAGELVGAVGSILGGLGALKDQMWDVLFTLGAGIINGILQGIRSIRPDQVLSPLFDLLEGVVKGVKRFLGIAAPSGVFVEIGAGMIQGLQEGITAAWDGLMGLLDDKFGGVIAFAKDIFGVSSPSRVFTAIGKDVALGMAQGISENEAVVLNTVRRVSDIATSSARKVVNGYLQSVNVGMFAAANNLPGNISLQDLTRETQAPVTGLSFARGGTVPGPIGQPRLAVVHGGERAIPNGASANVQVTIVNNGAIGVPDLEEMIANLITARFRRGGYQEIFS